MAQQDSVPFVHLFIDGKKRPSSTGATFAVHNPYHKTQVATSASASADDCRAAIESAHRAFPAWEAAPLAVRRDIFLRAAVIMESEEWQRKAIEALRDETASTDAWAKFNSIRADAALRNVAAMVNELKGETFPSVWGGGQAFVQRRAQGVVYSVVPWNGPIPLAIRGAAIPMICGNTVVLRPSEYSPRTQALVVDAFHEAGLPPGVLNYIPISREDSIFLTPEIIAHPFVRKITFTGSDRVGKIIAAEAARHLKPCVLELGGKAPAIVLADADIDAAARGIVYGGLFNSGQICMSTERVIIQRPADAPLIEALKKNIASLNVGAPESARLSALFNEGSAEGVVGLLEDAKAAGAELVLGDATREGTVVKPHLVLGVSPGMRLWERESFGPILSIAVVDTVDEAVELANSSEYTLAASLWTNDVYNAMDVAMRVRSGATNINGPTLNTESGLGNAGIGGASGYGRFDVENFTDKRLVVIHPRNRTYPMLDT